jgi:endonuclease I
MPDLIITKGNDKQSGQPSISGLCTLVAWNDTFPVTAFEKRRNDRVQKLQGNRNPFIDHPEFVDGIWASKCS